MEEYKIAMILLIIGIAMMFVFVGHSAKIKGAKEACSNTGMYLNQDFECEELPERKGGVQELKPLNITLFPSG